MNIMTSDNSLLRHFTSTAGRLIIAMIFVFSIRPITTGAAASERPNILFIYADDQSHRTVSCYEQAYDWVRTPHIDQLASTGVRFTDAYIGTWCMPSRATMLTGRHPYGVQSMRMVGQYPGSEYDPQQCQFWPSVFRANGYQTAHIGKWHTGTDTGYGRDWDYQVVWNRPRFPDNSSHYYYDEMIEINGGEAKLVEGYSTDNYTEWAIDYIKGNHRNPDQPWYLWLCYGAVHGPFTPADRHLNEYPGAEIPIPADIYPPRPGKPDYMQNVESWVEGSDGQPHFRTQEGRTLNEWVRQYHQAVIALDEGIGRVVKAVEDSGQRNNTLIVYTVDQGFAWGQHGFRHKLAPYDANMRAPFMASLPGRIPAGRVCTRPIGGADLIPTFFNFAGIETPWKMHGHDLTPLLLNPNAEWDHPVLLTLTGASYGTDTDRIPAEGPTLYRGGGIPWWVFLRDGKYKYIRTLVKNQVEELYDLQEDPEELTNLALDASFRSKLTQFRDATLAELKRTDAGMANNLPSVATEKPSKR